MLRSDCIDSPPLPLCGDYGRERKTATRQCVLMPGDIIRLPLNWWHTGVLLVPLVSCLGSLSLKFNFRYVFHFLPATLVLVAIGAIGAARLIGGGRGQLWAGGRTVVGLGICLAMAVARSGSLGSATPMTRKQLPQEPAIF